RLSNAEVADKLTNLGFEIRRSDRESLQVAPPTFRVDMHNEVDLIEEVGRIYGYDKIPETMPGIMVRRGNAGAGVRSRERALRELLTGLGFYEAIHYSFIPDEDAQRHGFDPAAQPRLANPLTVEQAILRPFLLSGLLKTVNLNQRQGADSIRLFEIGKVFSAGARAGHEEDEGFSLALTLAGDEPMNWTAQTGQPRKFDFYDLKGVVEAILREFCGDGEWKIRALEGHGAREYHPGRSAQIMVGDEKIGQFGEMHPAMAAQYDLRGRIYAGEINLAAILKRRGEIARKFEPLPKFPSSERDLALVVDARVPAGDLVDAAMTFGKPLVEELSVIDLYSGSPIPEGKKSLALRFRLRSAEGTLTDEEINALMARIANGLQSSCGATLRA
ncbi:phenylalanine--tRNA ligase subunit beta, partial [Candidatus Sumerlaeota bacterium]|nr:phenylalanine--tRNA ligase subunit beta [Candidatus Sumerlaeota bacterium]